jgi:hypothetical protein
MPPETSDRNNQVGSIDTAFDGTSNGNGWRRCQCSDRGLI